VIEGLLGRKLGMVQLFDKEGRMRAATVIEAGPCLVTQLRTTEKDGYQAVQLGYGAKRRLNKPMRGHLKRLGDLRHLREFRVDDPGLHKVGERVGVEIFQEGDEVDITGTSKGRGFAGGVKRHGFRGGPKTHGQSDRHRAPGAIGAGNTPGRVFKGLRMAGHMGAEQVTVRNLEVLQSNAARGLLLVAGAVPGARNGLLKIRYTKKTLEVARDRKVAVEPEAPIAEEEDVPTEAEQPADVAEAPATEETPTEAAEEAPVAASEEPAEEPAAEAGEASEDEDKS
jgi:large subunit ribosomal protein L3